MYTTTMYSQKRMALDDDERSRALAKKLSEAVDGDTLLPNARKATNADGTHEQDRPDTGYAHRGRAVSTDDWEFAQKLQEQENERIK